MNAQHIVLARSERPANFDAVIGQEHVIKALKHSFAQVKVHHAYLFTGTRGVGKTTISRIIAKCLNCETGITAEPCGKCSNCLEIVAGNFVDLYEIDAASNTRVEDMRELLSKAQYAPTKGRYKVFLIDEVHMLSNHSFNALLKTLEEPPQHVQFILATTEPEKLPATIISRCLHFRLQPLDVSAIQQQMQKITASQSIQAVPEALQILAEAAAGSMRDGLSLLDQAIAHGQGELTEANVRQMLGLSDAIFITNIISMAYAQDAVGLRQQLGQMQQQGCRFAKTMQQLQGSLSRIALRQFIPDYACSTQEADLALQMDPETVQLYYEIVTSMQKNFALHPSPKIAFSMTVLRMLAFTLADVGTPVSVPQPVAASSVANPVNHVATPSSASSIPAAVAPSPVASASVTTTQAASLPTVTGAVDWVDLHSQLHLAGAARALAVHFKLQEHSGNKWIFSCSRAYMSLCNKEILGEIEVALSNHFNTDIKVEVESGSQMDASADRIRPSQNSGNIQRKQSDIGQDVNIQAIMQRFDAEIISSSAALQKHSETGDRND